jgi:hypothetical protein
MRLFVPQTCIFVLILLLTIPAAAHVPVLPGDHNSLETALQIRDPAVSYAIYGTLHEAGEADYYTVTLRKGDLLTFSVSTPVQGSYAPWLVIAGPGLIPQGAVPAGIRLPEGDTTVVVTGVRPFPAEYEPFSPMALYQTAMYEGTAPADGVYVIAVYTPDAGGPYTFASGKLEAFTATEWIMVPVNLIGVRLWQEQSPLLIFGPYLVVLIAGMILMLRWPGRQRMSIPAWLGFAAGLLYIGTGAATLLQTGIALQVATGGPAVLVTLVFAAIQICAGGAAVSTSLRPSGSLPLRFRIQMIVIGIVGLVAWGGLIIGPVLAFAAALVPARTG